MSETAFPNILTTLKIGATQIKGLDSFEVSGEDTETDLTTGDVKRSIFTERGRSFAIGLSWIVDRTTGVGDAGQQALLDLATKTHAASVGTFTAVLANGDEVVFQATASLGDAGGSKTGKSTLSFTLKSCGAVELVETPVVD